jgi:hypothetical protein
MRKTRIVWGQDVAQIGDMPRNSETELLDRRAEMAKNFQIKIRYFRWLGWRLKELQVFFLLELL